MTPTKPMTNKEEREYVLNLLDKFLKSINDKEEVLIELDKQKGCKPSQYWNLVNIDIYTEHKTRLEELYYLKSLLDKRLGELKNEQWNIRQTSINS
jgi:hypothetical protein